MSKKSLFTASLIALATATLFAPATAAVSGVSVLLFKTSGLYFINMELLSGARHNHQSIRSVWNNAQVNPGCIQTTGSRYTEAMRFHTALQSEDISERASDLLKGDWICHIEPSANGEFYVESTSVTGHISTDTIHGNEDRSNPIAVCTPEGQSFLDIAAMPFKKAWEILGCGQPDPLAQDSREL